MDTVDAATRSKNMSRIGQKNTGPEMKLRRSLHKIGLRYVLHDKRLPGTPDLVFPKFMAVVFVHGCFWHRHGCPATATPGTRTAFWQKKFEGNIARDRRKNQALLELNWKVAVVWECALKGTDAKTDEVAKLLFKWLRSTIKTMEIPTC